AWGAVYTGWQALLDRRVTRKYCCRGGGPIPMGHCPPDLSPRTWSADAISADRATFRETPNAQPQHWRRLALLGPDTRSTRVSDAPRFRLERAQPRRVLRARQSG